jgi:hypothetical protein
MLLMRWVLLLLLVWQPLMRSEWLVLLVIRVLVMLLVLLALRMLGVQPLLLLLVQRQHVIGAGHASALNAPAALPTFHSAVRLTQRRAFWCRRNPGRDANRRTKRRRPPASCRSAVVDWRRTRWPKGRWMPGLIPLYVLQLLRELWRVLLWVLHLSLALQLLRLLWLRRPRRLLDRPVIPDWRASAGPGTLCLGLHNLVSQHGQLLLLLLHSVQRVMVSAGRRRRGARARQTIDCRRLTVAPLSTPAATAITTAATGVPGVVLRVVVLDGLSMRPRFSLRRR